MGDKAKGKNKGTAKKEPKPQKVAKDKLRPHEQRQQDQAGR